DNSRNDRFDRATIVIGHCSFVSSAIHNFLCNGKLRIRHIGKVFDLCQKVIVKASIQLGDPFSTIRIGDTVFGPRELILDLLSALFSLLPTKIVLDYIGKLNNQVKLSGTRLLVHCIKQIQFTNKPLHCSVRLVHDRIERIRDYGYHSLGQGDFFFFTSTIVVKPNANVIWKPFHDRSYSHRVDLVRICRHGVEIRIYGDNRHNTLFKHTENNILNESSTSLIDIGRQIKASIEIRINGFVVTTIFVKLYMLNGNGASVNCNTTKNCSDNSLIYSTTFAVIERSIAIATIVRIVSVAGRISVKKRIPGPLHARTNVNFHFDFSSLVEPFLVVRRENHFGKLLSHLLA